MREDDHYLSPELIYSEGVFERPTVFAANAYYLFCAVSLVFTIIANIIILSVVPLSLFKLSYYIVSSFVEIVIFGMLPLLYASRNPSTIRAFRLNMPERSMLGLAVLLAALCVFFSNALGSLWMLFIERLGGTLVSNDFLIPASGGDLLTLVFVAGVLPGVCEEIMFRGMILGAWESRGGKPALVITSLLFAALHASVLGFPSQLMAAFVLGMLALCSGSIYPGIVFHVLYNSALLAASYFSGSSGELPEGATLYESVGGAAGALQILMMCLFFGALVFGTLAAVYRLGARRRKVFIERQGFERRPREMIVLAAALVTVASLFLINLATVFGVPV